MNKLLRKLYYFPLQPWFLKLVGLLIFKTKTSSNNFNVTKVKQILVVKLDEIGDFILCTPFLRELRRNFPDSKITLIVKKEVFNLAEHCPYVNIVIPLDLKMNKVFRVVVQYNRVLKICKKYLWKENYDLAIIPRWDGDANYHAFTAYFSRAKNVIGYNLNNGTEKLLNLPVPKNVVEHEVINNLYLINHLGGNINNDKLEFWLSDEDRKYADNFIRQLNTNLFITIAPGAAIEKRIWPKENYKGVISKFINEIDSNTKFILLGSQNEIHIGEYIIEGLENSVINLIGKTTLRQVAALIVRSKLFIGNDSGLMHIAAAIDIPVIEISSFPLDGSNYGVNSPFRFGPWTDRKKILQPSMALKPCKDKCIMDTAHCITQITVNEVFEVVKEMINIEQRINK